MNSPTAIRSNPYFPMNIDGRIRKHLQGPPYHTRQAGPEDQCQTVTILPVPGARDPPYYRQAQANPTSGRITIGTIGENALEGSRGNKSQPDHEEPCHSKTERQETHQPGRGSSP